MDINDFTKTELGRKTFGTIVGETVGLPINIFNLLKLATTVNDNNTKLEYIYISIKQIYKARLATAHLESSMPTSETIPEDIISNILWCLGNTTQGARADIILQHYETTQGFTNLEKIISNNTTIYQRLPHIESLYKERLHYNKVVVFKHNKLLIVVTDKLEHANHADAYALLASLIPSLYQNIGFTKLKECFRKAFENTLKSTDINEVFNKELNLKELIKNERQKKVEKLIDNLQIKLRNENEQSIKTLKNDIKDSEENLKRLYIRLNNLMRTEPNKLQNEDLLKQFLLNNDLIDNITYGNQAIYLTIKTKVDWDRKAAKTICKHKTPLINELFTTDKYNMYWKASCIIDLAYNRVQHCTGNYTNQEIPNAHWEFYNCFGDNLSIINKAIINKDLFTATAQILTAAPKLNIYDSTVFERLIRFLMGSRYQAKVFEDKETGELLSLYDIKERMDNNAKTN